MTKFIPYAILSLYLPICQTFINLKKNNIMEQITSTKKTISIEDFIVALEAVNMSLQHINADQGVDFHKAIIKGNLVILDELTAKTPLANELPRTFRTVDGEKVNYSKLDLFVDLGNIKSWLYYADTIEDGAMISESVLYAVHALTNLIETLAHIA